jgi:hypothetical protein
MRVEQRHNDFVALFNAPIIFTALPKAKLFTARPNISHE